MHSIKRIITNAVLLPGLFLSAGYALAAPADASPQSIQLSQFEQSADNYQNQQTAAKQQTTSKQIQPMAQPTQQQQEISQLEQGSSTSPATPAQQPKFVIRQPTVQQLMHQAPSYDQKQAYTQMLHQSMPMTPSQIIDLKRRMAAAQRAASASPEAPPQPMTSSRIVNLAPGATPPTIRLQQGFITTLDFVDASGQPWPVKFLDNGNPNAFNVSWDKKGNMLMIQALKPYTYGNLAVSLKGLNTPIMLTLVPGQRAVDYRVDLRVSGLAPGSKNSDGNMSGLPDSTNQKLLQVLDGVAPKGSKQLQVDGDAAQVWQKGNKMFVRSKFAILSPGWMQHMRSPDGTNAYIIQKTPMILVSQFGNPVEVKINSN